MPRPDDDAPEREDAPRDLAGWLAPYLRDPSLWPVTLVVFAIAVVLGASGLLLAFAERNPFALGAVLLALWISVDVSLRERRRGRPPRVAIGALALWLASAAAAVAARSAGWF